jgi:preprotein translocase subunit SecG
MGLNFVLNLVLVLQIVSALAMIGLILMQHGKGADMGAAFGSGARAACSALRAAPTSCRATAVLATVFFACTLALAYFGFSIRSSEPTGGSVLERAAVTAPRHGGRRRRLRPRAPPPAFRPPCRLPPRPAPACRPHRPCRPRARRRSRRVDAPQKWPACLDACGIRTFFRVNSYSCP